MHNNIIIYNYEHFALTLQRQVSPLNLFFTINHVYILLVNQLLTS